MNDPEINSEEVVFHSLRHTSATAKLFMSNGDYNSVMQAGGWSSLEMLPRRYGKHSFMSNREKLAEKMDDFLGGRTEEHESTNSPSTVEQALKTLLETSPEMLMEFIRSVQSANKE